jgi:hypothetical protein
VHARRIGALLEFLLQKKNSFLLLVGKPGNDTGPPKV